MKKQHVSEEEYLKLFKATLSRCVAVDTLYMTSNGKEREKLRGMIVSRIREYMVKDKELADEYITLMALAEGVISSVAASSPDDQPCTEACWLMSKIMEFTEIDVILKMESTLGCEEINREFKYPDLVCPPLIQEAVKECAGIADFAGESVYMKVTHVKDGTCSCIDLFETGGGEMYLTGRWDDELNKTDCAICSGLKHNMLSRKKAQIEVILNFKEKCTDGNFRL